MSPSSSEAVPEQVRVEVVYTPVLGLMVTESTVGAVLSTVTEADPASVPPSESVAVAVQVMVSSGELLEAVSVTLLPVPKLVPSVSLLQA